MAAKLEYDIPPVRMPGAKEEWDALLEALHRSGTLRVLRGFFGRLGPVSDVALGEINSEPGQNLVGGLLAIGQVLTRVPANQAAKLAVGVAVGARQALSTTKPPGIFKLVRSLFSADTRRALGTILNLLHQIGTALRQPVPSQPKK